MASTSSSATARSAVERDAGGRRYTAPGFGRGAFAMSPHRSVILNSIRRLRL